MEEMIQIVDGKPMTTSLLVADKFKKEHKHILRDVRSILDSRNNCKALSHFIKSSYTSSQGKKLPMYLLDKDGFMFLVMGFTGDKAAEWKWNFIDAFNKMADRLKLLEQQEIGRIIERQKSIEVRKTLTDIIRDEVPETPHKKFMYKNYTDLAYKTCLGKNTKQLKNDIGLSKNDNLRDYLTKDELRIVKEKESLIKELIKNGYSYSDIKNILKKKFLAGGNCA